MHTGVLQAARIQGLEGEVHLQSIKNGTTLLHREIFKARTLARRLIYTRTTTYCPFISEAIIAVKLSYGKQSQFYRATLLISSNSSSALALPPLIIGCANPTIPRHTTTTSTHRAMADSEAAGTTYEEEHVHEVYEQIASHFSSTRYKVCVAPPSLATNPTNHIQPWPIVERFLKEQPDGAVGADVGCGNGKYLAVNKKVFIVGSDRYVFSPSSLVHGCVHSSCLTWSRTEHSKLRQVY